MNIAVMIFFFFFKTSNKNLSEFVWLTIFVYIRLFLSLIHTKMSTHEKKNSPFKAKEHPNQKKSTKHLNALWVCGILSIILDISLRNCGFVMLPNDAKWRRSTHSWFNDWWLIKPQLRIHMIFLMSPFLMWSLINIMRDRKDFHLHPQAKFCVFL